MYTKIALVLLGMVVSVGGALALVLAQSSSVKRPLAPQIALSSPDMSEKSRTDLREEMVVVAPSTGPVLGAVEIDTPDLLETPLQASVVPQPQNSAATIEADAPRAPIDSATFGASTSQPNVSPFAGLANGLNTAPTPQARSLGLIEAPQERGAAVANTWAIGVYR